MMMMVTEKNRMVMSKSSYKLHGYNGPLCFTSPEDPDRISPTTASGSTVTTTVTSQYNERFCFLNDNSDSLVAPFNLLGYLLL